MAGSWSKDGELMIDAYNDKSRWADAGIYKAPFFACHSFQRKIDKIVGVSPSGLPIVRLSWAWDCRKWENIEWDEFGNATKGEWRQRYRALTINLDGDDFVDIAPPRWVLEERFEPEGIAVNCELTRYRQVVTEPVPVSCKHCQGFGGWAPLEILPPAWLDVSKVKDGKMWLSWWHPDQSEGHLLCCRFCSEYTELATVKQDVWGGVPREGWYNLLPYGAGIIADHSTTCCKEAKDLGEICYGTYALPSDRELNRLRRAIQRRSKDAETNPHISPELDEVALQQAKVWGLQGINDAKVKRRGELAEIQWAHRKSPLVYV